MITDQCSYRIYSGARWDMGGHLCSITARHEEDGKTWCKRHLPSNVAAREAKKSEEARASRIAMADHKQKRSDEITQLCAALGIGEFREWLAYGRHYQAPADGISISIEQLRRMAGS